MRKAVVVLRAFLSIAAGASLPAGVLGDDRPFLTDRHLRAEERQAPLGLDLLDAINRVEGMYDPTRFGLFGRSVRMTVRPGTASTNNVFADRWTYAVLDPNIHYRTRYLAQTWMWTQRRSCDAFSRYRPNESAVVFDLLTPEDCAQIARFRENERSPAAVMPVVSAPLAVPTFAAPYLSGSFSEDQLRAAMEARVAAAKQRLLLNRYKPALRPSLIPTR